MKIQLHFKIDGAIEDNTKLPLLTTQLRVNHFERKASTGNPTKAHVFKIEVSHFASATLLWAGSTILTFSRCTLCNSILWAIE